MYPYSVWLKKAAIRFLVVGFIVQLEAFHNNFCVANPISGSSESSSSDVSKSLEMLESSRVSAIMAVPTKEALKKNDHKFHLL